ncbi:MAG TPA: thioredoxin domain-containing protein [Gemmatimonadaceae bacterium]|jgi:protein-disulfide isomerase
MTQFCRRLLAVALGAGIAACSRTDASPKTPAVATASTDANSSAGSVALPAAGGAPHDTTTDKADRGRILGAENAKVWVVMVSDFQCPFCKQWHDAQFQSVLPYAQKGQIRLAFINFPLNIHPNAVPAAEAAMCASMQNKFWPMHEALFAAQNQWVPLPDPSAKLESLAAGVAGLDMNAWKTCVAKHTTRALIEADHDRWRAAGVGSTPGFSVNGKMLTLPDGSSPGAGADVVGAIEAALKAQR